MAGSKCKQINKKKRWLNTTPFLPAYFVCLSIIYVLIVLTPFGYVRAEHHCNHQHPRADEVRSIAWNLFVAIFIKSIRFILKIDLFT